jgi:hypothetical protein
VAFGPVLLLLAPIVILVGWSRLHLHAYTVMQVLAGGALGAVLGGGVFWLVA